MPLGRSERFEALFRTAEAQAGFFTAQQALEAGYSQRLLTHHTQSRHLERHGHGIYRLVHFPQVSDAEDLVVHWLWSAREGVYVRTTALQLHGLSDAMPERATMAVPASWSKRRLRVPPAVRLIFEDVPRKQVEVIQGVAVTGAARTVNDCARASVEPHLVGQAVREGLERGLFREQQVTPALSYVAEHGA
jgi:predicted transcriptional regulator of viral defense system